MAKSIEIYENTLLKLIVRQGPDSQRKQIILDAGELGYSTDTKRLYIGDGSNDTCGALFLKEKDYLFARKNYELHQIIQKSQNDIKCKLILWSSGKDIINIIKDL
jgi:hypothetical protein